MLDAHLIRYLRAVEQLLHDRLFADTGREQLREVLASVDLTSERRDHLSRVLQTSTRVTQTWLMELSELALELPSDTLAQRVDLLLWAWEPEPLGPWAGDLEEAAEDGRLAVS